MWRKRTTHSNQTLNDQHHPRWAHVILLFALCLALYLPGLFTIAVTDRDEARFAQASKQMVESGEYFQIRFQDEPRHKKPPGIYWLQALSVHAAEAITGQDDLRNEIWPYRLPSVLAAAGTVFVLYFFLAICVGSRLAFLSALLLAASVLLNAEAHLATTDAVLTLCTTINFCVLMRYSLQSKWAQPIDPRDRRHVPWALPILFWSALSLGILIKGPLAVFFPAVAIIVMGVATRSWAMLRPLRIMTGCEIVLVFSLCWMVPLHFATDGAFFREALFGDLLPKLGAGVESHGAWPGYYLVLLLATFWPGSLIVGAAVRHAWRGRKTSTAKSNSHRGTQWALAWLIPAWLILEVVPTKLPHYVLPLYPALAFLCAQFVVGLTTASEASTAEEGELDDEAIVLRKPAYLGFVIWSLLTIVFGFALVAGLQAMKAPTSTATIVVMIGLSIASIWPTWCAFRNQVERGLKIACLCAICIIAPLLQWVLPTQPTLRLSGRIHEVINATKLLDPASSSSSQTLLIAVGYHEPSLVFLSAQPVQLVGARKAAELVQQNNQPSTRIIVAATSLDRVEEELASRGLTGQRLQALRGFNYSKGEWITVYIMGEFTMDTRHASLVHSKSECLDGVWSFDATALSSGESSR